MCKIRWYFAVSVFLLSTIQAFSIPDNYVLKLTDTIAELDFYETFESGSLQTNQWTAGTSNWGISSQGNPGKSLLFYCYPAYTNYSSALTSCLIDGTGIDDSRIFLDFDISRSFNSATCTEFLSVDIFNGTEWIEKVKYTNARNGTWVKKSIDITNQASGNTFRIRFRAEGANALNIINWLIDNISIYRKCNPPKNLSAIMPDPIGQPCIMDLDWSEPEFNYLNSWISQNNGENHQPMSIPGGVVYAAIRFRTFDLIELDGYYLTKLKFFATNPGGIYTLKVWKGTNAAQLIASQVVTSYTSNRWNEYELDTQVVIDASEELWLGFELIQPNNVMIAGIDIGPASVGLGDLISFDATTWYSMAEVHKIDGNFNLAGFVSDTAKRKELKQTHSLTEYQIYRNNEYLASTPLTGYSDNFSDIEWPCYKVKAVYSDCESGFSDSACLAGNVNPCTVGLVDNQISTVNIFPNPSSAKLTLMASEIIKQVNIFDLTGRKVLEQDFDSPDMTYILDVSQLTDGMYIIQLVSHSEKYSTSKLIIDK